MSTSTKETVKRVALALFAKKGFEGASMSEIADGVGIKKASLYAHFKGKEELYFAVYEDLAREYVDLMHRIMRDAERLDVPGKLYAMFEQYLVYYIENPEVQAFWNQITLFTPPEVHDQFFSHAKNCDAVVQQWLEEVLCEGMRQGLIRTGDAKKMSMSYRAMREGLLNGIMMLPKLYKEGCIKEFWTDYWLGIKGRD